MVAHHIPLTRRALLGLLAAGAAWSLAGCRMPANPLQAPPTPVPVHTTRVGLVIRSQLAAAGQQAVLAAYQEAVDAVAAEGLTVDRQVDSIPLSSPNTPANDVATAFVSASASGAPVPDLLIFGQTSSGGLTSYTLSQLASASLLLPIDAAFSRASAQDRQDYFPNALDACRVGGKLYGLPLVVDPALLLVDPRLLQGAGLATPGDWDWSGLLNAGQRLTRAPGQYAFAPETFDFPEVFLWQHGAAVLSADGTHSTLDDPGAIEAATFYGDLFTRYKVVAPPVANVGGWTGTPDHQLRYNTARIAMVYTAGSEPDRPLEFSEPFHDQDKATVLFLNSVLAMTARAADPAQTFPVMTALAMELQQRSYLPPRRSLLQTAQPVRELSGWLPSDLSQAEQTALTNALGYARASQVSDPAISAPFYSKLQFPLQQGTATAADACKAAADAINAVLEGGAGTPGPA